MWGLGVAELIWAVALLAYVSVVAQRSFGGHSTNWKLKTAGAWLLIFGGLFVLARHLDWTLP